MLAGLPCRFFESLASGPQRNLYMNDLTIVFFLFTCVTAGAGAGVGVKSESVVMIDPPVPGSAFDAEVEVGLNTASESVSREVVCVPNVEGGTTVVAVEAVE